jgi:hypothetical protein
MAKRKSQKTQTDLKELVVVSFAEDVEQAKEYEALLKSNDIPAMVKERYDKATDSNEIAVLVPDEFIDEAHVVIESQDAYDDFCDIDIAEDEDSAFDDDFSDDDNF